MKDGRPLRFLAATAIGWIGLRTIMLWSGDAPLTSLVAGVTPPLAAAVLRPPGGTAASSPTRRATARAKTMGGLPPSLLASPTAPARAPAPAPILFPGPTVRGHVRTDRDPDRPTPLAPFPVAASPSRLSGSLWLLARGGGGGTLSGGRLGASQAGIRLTYALDGGRRIALTARLATPLREKGKEIALGLEWRPTRLPVRIVAEQRAVPDGGRGGPTLGVIGGYGPAAIAPGIRLEAYGQAGAIARDGIEAFVDTAARVTHPGATLGTVRLDLGIGTWVSAQRAAARFDLGPTVGVAIPVAHRTLRLSLDWRERVAGRSAPGSGPALTIGSDF